MKSEWILYGLIAYLVFKTVCGCDAEGYDIWDRAADQKKQRRSRVGRRVDRGGGCRYKNTNIHWFGLSSREFAQRKWSDKDGWICPARHEDTGCSWGDIDKDGNDIGKFQCMKQ